MKRRIYGGLFFAAFMGAGLCESIAKESGNAADGVLPALLCAGLMLFSAWRAGYLYKKQ